MVEQSTITSVTSALPTVPVPPVTVHVCVGPAGCVLTVTAKAPPLATVVAKVNVPLALTARSSVLLFWRTRPVPESPITVPPILKFDTVQVTVTFVTFAVAVPWLLATVHCCVGIDGCVPTVTSYIAPAATAVLNANAPLALTARVSAPFLSVRPFPDRPLTVPLTV